MTYTERLARMTKTTPETVKAVGISEEESKRKISHIRLWNIGRWTLAVLCFVIIAAVINYDSGSLSPSEMTGTIISTLMGIGLFAAFSFVFYDPESNEKDRMLRNVIRHITGKEKPHHRYDDLGKLAGVSAEQIESIGIPEEKIKNLNAIKLIAAVAGSITFLLGIFLMIVGGTGVNKHRHTPDEETFLYVTGIGILIFFSTFIFSTVAERYVKNQIMKHATARETVPAI